MTRVRISTTVDGERLDRARRALRLRDSELFDVALEAALRESIIASELAALERLPYATDPELALPGLPGDDGSAFPYDGDVPAHVRELAQQRRAHRTRPTKP